MHVGYRILEPFALNPLDQLSLNGAVARIASFLGLREMFIVCTTGKVGRVAGSIEHDAFTGASYIEVSRDLLRFPNSVLATVAHEVTHAYMRGWGIGHGGSNLQDSHENEILTDICAVFLGLGKLLLNGTQEQYVYSETVPEGTRRVTETQSVGYLKADEMAFVYRFICAARKIPSSIYTANLVPASKKLVRESEAKYHAYFDRVLERAAASRDDAQKQIDVNQALLSNLMAKLSYLDKSFIRPSLDEFRRMHVQNKGALERLGVSEKEEYDPVLQFITAVEDGRSFDDLRLTLEELGTKCSELLRGWERVVSAAKGNLRPAEPSQEQQISCPIDGTPIAPDKSGRRVVCPKCGYRFVVGETLDNPPVESPRSVEQQSKRSFLSRLLNHR